MSILDSDVLLVLISSTEEEQVVDWAKQFPSKPQTTALSVAEVKAAILSVARPRAYLGRDQALENLLGGLLHRRILPLDIEAAGVLADLSRTRRPGGGYYPLAILIQAAIAKHFRLPLVTGRPGDYQGLEVELYPLELGGWAI